jgi:hypothetical protein
MVNLLIGIAIGAAFSKFWIMLYDSAKPTVVGWFSKAAPPAEVPVPTPVVVPVVVVPVPEEPPKV